MCGSGTFSLEASMVKQNIPPGFARVFAFQSLQCFRKQKWNYIKNQAQNKFNLDIQKDIFASDIDEKAIDAIKQNIKKFNFNKNINIIKKDFFDIYPDKLTKQKGVIVLNPPYGKRIGNQYEISSFYNELGKKLFKDFKGWRLGIIMPEKRLLKNYKFQKTMIRSFYHGGLDIFLLTATI
jgi:putative N6-adenine-specific DNA methylase